MRLSVLGSGSSGNCTYLSTSRVSILVDLGIGGRSLERRLHEVSLNGDGISAVFLTHGHSDHHSGIVPFACKRRIPIFTTVGTMEEVPGLWQIPSVVIVRPGEQVILGDLTVIPFRVSHDAAEPVGFRFEAEGIRGTLATDLGEITPEVDGMLRGCDWLILESNHDEDLLRVGQYPWHLKERLLGPLGHLSNNALARFLSGSFDGAARHIFLAHLSQENNRPALALETARKALEVRTGVPSGTFSLHLTHQLKPSIVLEL